MTTCEAYLKKQKQLVEARLQTLLHAEDKGFASLYEAMNYSLLAGGKRVRPTLLLATVEALGKTAAPYLDVACALECIHTYSLIHDDLPAMDDDALRRGKPTNHVMFGEGMAILAGDGLLTFAFELLAAQQQIEAVKRCQCMAVIARAAGPAGMVGGQAYDLNAEGNRHIGVEGLQFMHYHKTGIIFEAAIEIAAILADATPAIRDCLRTYAYQLGLTFQITDDILDYSGDAAMLGKPVGSDAKNHKATYVTLFSLAEARSMAQEAATNAIMAVSALGEEAWFLRQLATYLLQRVR